MGRAGGMVRGRDRGISMQGIGSRHGAGGMGRYRGHGQGQG